MNELIRSIVFSNEFTWITLLLTSFFCILLVYRLFGRTGLYIWIPIATITANIQVIKVVSLFGIDVTLGNIVYASSFLVTDILSENYGKKAAQRAVAMGFFSLLSVSLLMNLAIRFTPSASDSMHEHISSIFSLMPRLAVASLAAYLISQVHDVWAYQWWRRRLPAKRHIWLRNNASTMISQLLDTSVFCTIAFSGMFGIFGMKPFFDDSSVFWSVFISTYVIKWFVAACDTPFVYIARWMRDNNAVGAEVEIETHSESGS